MQHFTFSNVNPGDVLVIGPIDTVVVVTDMEEDSWPILWCHLKGNEDVDLEINANQIIRRT